MAEDDPNDPAWSQTFDIYRHGPLSGAYLGLQPGQYQSGKSDPQARITKAGDVYLRSLLVNCAHYIPGRFGPESDLRTWGLALAQRGGKSARKRAIVAVARKLAVLLHRLWVSHADYVPIGYAAKRETG